ncbi:unnamed protein product [Thelazia callipaeda]|uniref:Uncharacterized protein n=1 Tax=Thelazia callipaeda TaxID=103827 RepID=A0A0N5D061_THECL|nr:unnamed protein product [Thelazia callipaeda]
MPRLSANFASSVLILVFANGIINAQIFSFMNKSNGSSTEAPNEQQRNLQIESAVNQNKASLNEVDITWQYVDEDGEALANNNSSVIEDTGEEEICAFLDQNDPLLQEEIFCWEIVDEDDEEPINTYYGTLKDILTAESLSESDENTSNENDSHEKYENEDCLSLMCSIPRARWTRCFSYEDSLLYLSCIELSTPSSTPQPETTDL